MSAAWPSIEHESTETKRCRGLLPVQKSTRREETDGNTKKRPRGRFHGTLYNLVKSVSSVSIRIASESPPNDLLESERESVQGAVPMKVERPLH